MKRKDNTVQCKFHPLLTVLLFDIDGVYRTKWDAELTITSGSETTARHSHTSLHYNDPCQAADLRSWAVGLIPSAAQQVLYINIVVSAFCIEHNIPENWIEVILESDHIHIEYQPKRQDT